MTPSVNEYFEGFDGAGGGGFGTGEVVEGGDGLLTAEVDDEEVRKRRLPRRLPVSGLLEIEDFITGEVTTIDFLTVSIFHRPRFTRKTIRLWQPPVFRSETTKPE